MQDFDIDVSGEDIFSRNYTVCVADRGNIIKGFKIRKEFIRTINSRYVQCLYRYKRSKKARTLLKIRIYSIIIFNIFKEIKPKNEIKLNICRDFNGREEDIKSNLNYFLKDLLKLNVREFSFNRLPSDSIAHRYAYLMSKDTKNKLKTYINISIPEFETFLKSTKGHHKECRSPSLPPWTRTRRTP